MPKLCEKKTAHQPLPEGSKKWDDLDMLERRLLAEEDFYWFCVEVMGYPDLYYPLHKDLVCDFLQTFEDAAEPVGNLELARGHFKSTLASICYPLWRLMRDPNLRILISHGKRDTAVKILSELKFHLQHNDRLKGIAPDVFCANPVKQSATWKADEVSVIRRVVDKVPSLMATGVDASVVGLHFNLIIQDDLVFKENVGTSDMREKTKEYRRECFALLRPGGKLLNIGTRWHFDDAHAELEEGAEGEGPYGGMVHQLKLGCLDKDGEPLFATRWTHEKFAKMQQMMGSHVFSCQFHNSPIPDGEAYFKRTDIRWFDDLPGWSAIPGEDPDSIKPYTIWTAIDPNRSEDTMHDPAAIMTGALDADGHMWVLDISRGHPTGTELIKLINEHLQKWNPEGVILEVNNFQYQIQTWLKESHVTLGRHWPLIPVTRGPKSRKVDRIGALQPLLETNRLHLRNGMEVVAQELEHWPHWKNDDTLDCLADIYQYGRRPIPKRSAAAPSNFMSLESVMRDIRRSTSGPARIGRGRNTGTEGWRFR